MPPLKLFAQFATVDSVLLQEPILPFMATLLQNGATSAVDYEVSFKGTHARVNVRMTGRVRKWFVGASLLGKCQGKDQFVLDIF